ncbi:MAG: hypothetical protein ACRC92_20750, partial [Peptostreptococcaceae bacterium]
GKAYLEFWLKTINNREPSGNRKLYTEEDIRGAIPGFFGNCLKAGGVPGEVDHPSLHIYSDNESSVMNFENNMSRIKRVERDRVCIYTTDYMFKDGWTYFKFRTCITNRIVIQDMLNGIAPQVSIRVTGKFSEGPDGIIRGKDVKFVTIDYVRNPGFKTAHLFQGSIDLVKSGSTESKKVEFTNSKNLSLSTAMESINDTDLISEAGGSLYACNSVYAIVVDDSNPTPKVGKTLEEEMNSISIL